jgi:signal transduction histidine kinase
MSRALQVIDRQSGRLTHLIHDLLDVSRIHSGRLPLRLEEVDLCAAVRDIVEQSREDLARARCPAVIHAARPVIGRWDRQRLEQVVSNLMSNAIKFGSGRPIEITVVESGGVARLVIQDHGTGIDPERLPYIFEKFERGVSTLNYGGFGLGLYITRSIAEALGGDVGVQSTVGIGSTFTVELPCRPQAAEARA